MKRTHRVLTSTLLGLLAGAIVALMAGAVVPGQVNYQGLLLDDQGQPLTQTLTLDFTLFDAPTAGHALWTESHPGVSVVDGVYHVTLGTNTPLDSTLVAGGSLYLEVTVAGEVLSPRQPLLVVPYALRAQDAEQLGGVDASFFQAMVFSFSFDGQAPANDDPREGTADVDGDGLANFVDPDNDNDGIPDGVEIAQGSDINLVTPTVGTFSPPTADGFVTSSVHVQGTNFEPGLMVSFGSENPTPTNLTSSGFDVEVGPQPEGDATVTVTRLNGETGSALFPFFLYVPVVSAFSPPTADGFVTSTIQVQGENFIPGLTVSFGTETPTPTNITPTSFDVEVGPQPEGDATVMVTLPNGKSTTASFPFFYYEPVINSVSPPRLGVGQAGTVTIQGQNFVPGLTVTFGSQSPTPTNLTATSFDFSVAGTEPAGYVDITVTLPNGKSTTNSDGLRVSDDRVIFVTSATHNGNLGGLAAADSMCNSLAQTAGLPGIYQAWLADSSQSPSTRSNQDGAFVRPDGVPLATSWADLTDGTLAANPAIDEALASHVGNVWTNVAAVGAGIDSATNHCSDWTSSSSQDIGRYGITYSSDTTWTKQGGLACNQPARLYCIEQ